MFNSKVSRNPLFVDERKHRQALILIIIPCKADFGQILFTAEEARIKCSTHTVKLL